MRLALKTLQYTSLLLLTAASLQATWNVIRDVESSWWEYLLRAFSPLLCIALLAIIVIRIAVPKLRMKLLEKLVTLIALIALVAPIARHIHTRYPHATTHLSSDIEDQFVSIIDLNVLGDRQLSKESIAEITKRNADVVTLQEVNPEFARAIQENLTTEFPCQIIRPATGTSGMALLSRFPCSLVADTVEGSWVGEPIVAKITPPKRRSFVVANVHALAPHMPTPLVGHSPLWSRLSQTVRTREESLANLLAILDRFRESPILIAGDLNATIRNRIYALIRNQGYKDGWLTLHDQTNGGTWPFPEFFGTQLLSWILRIDYVFYSDLLTPVEAKTIASTMGSDHKGLFFVFRELYALDA